MLNETRTTVTSESAYTIRAYFYRSTKDVEANLFCQTCDMGFAPMSMKDARTVLGKCSEAAPKNLIRIDKIVKVDA